MSKDMSQIAHVCLKNLMFECTGEQTAFVQRQTLIKRHIDDVAEVVK